MGGGIGLLINFQITSLLVGLSFKFLIAYIIGTLFNITFNFLYHWIITFGIPIQTRKSFAKFTILSVIAWSLNIMITTLIVNNFSISTEIVIFFAVSLMSIGNYFISSTFIFSSTIDPELIDFEKVYSSVSIDFYDIQQTTQNPIRSWFHTNRQKIIREQVSELSQDYSNPVIVDLGCGNCSWNIDDINVIGVDFNKYLLDYAHDQGRIREKIIAPTHETGISSDSVDIVIISEVIEHLIDPIPTLEEIYRILKEDGKLLVTVPYDTILSIWKPLFTLQCFLHGTIKRSVYYLNKCGHVKAYSPSSIKKLLESYFIIDHQSSMRRFSIITICKKKFT